MTQYAREYTIDDKPDIHVIVVGPHDPPIDELTLRAGIAASLAQIQNWQTHSSGLPFFIPEWPH